MSISDKTKKSLEKIGLTSYEIKTFSALLKSGEMTASDLSQKSGVPYSKIYEVLGALEDKGWIGSDDSRPTKYFAKAPSNALETSKQKADTIFSENKNVILSELIPSIASLVVSWESPNTTINSSQIGKTDFIDSTTG